MSREPTHNSANGETGAHGGTADLRDARLHAALTHAPDHDAMPKPATRASIQATAKAAVDAQLSSASENLHHRTNAATVPWWKELWTSMGARGGPWNAALATILLGSIITVLWYGQEVPSASQKTEIQTLDQAAAVEKPAPAPSTAAAPPTTNSGKDAVASSASGQLEKGRDAGSGRIKAQPAPAQPSQPATPGLEVTVGGSAGVKERVIGNPSPEGTAGEPANPSVQDSGKTESQAQTMRPPVPAVAQRKSVQAGLGERQRADDAAPWTSATIRANSNSAEVPRAKAEKLVTQALAIATAPGANAALAAAGPPLISFDLRDGTGATVATFDLWASAWRLRREGQPDRSGSVAPSVAQGIEAEALRLLALKDSASQESNQTR